MVSLFENHTLKIENYIKNVLEAILVLGLYWICDEQGGFKYLFLIFAAILIFFLKRKKIMLENMFEA